MCFSFRHAARRQHAVSLLMLALLSTANAQTVESPEHLQLNQQVAENLADLALKCIHKDFPNKPGHVITCDEEVKAPRDYHPAFYGCFDWHSAVHGHWTLVRLLKSFPDMSHAALIREKLDISFTPENLLAELAYFQNPDRKSFERLYGWAWLLKLAQELLTWDDADGQRWSEAMTPLSD